MSNPYEATGRDPVISGSIGRVRLKRIGPLSSALFGAAAGVIMGLIVGGFGFLASLAGINNAGGAGFAIGFGAGILIMAPLLYGVGGFIGGLINAVVYNIVASVSGGIEMEFGRE